MDLAQQAAELQHQIEQADRQRGRAEGQRQHAQAGLDSLAAQLRQEFGVSSPGQAAELLEQLEQQAGAELSKVKAALEAAGG